MGKYITLLGTALLLNVSYACANVTFGDTIENISNTGKDLASPLVGADASGNAVSTWINFDDDTIEARSYSKSAGAWTTSSVTTIANDVNLGDRHDLAVNANGQAVAVWIEEPTFSEPVYKFAAATFSTSNLTPMNEVTRPLNEAYFPSVGIDDNGDAVAIWYDTSNSNKEFYVTFSSGTWSSATKIPGQSDSNAYGIVAVNPSTGDAIAVWLNETDDQILASRYNKISDAWDTLPSPLTATGIFFIQGTIKVSYSRDGTAIAIWNNGGTIEASRFNGSTWSSSDTIAPIPLTTTPVVSPPSLGMDDNGNAVAVWADLSSTRIEAKHFNGTTWSAIADPISPMGSNPDLPEVAVYPNGNAVATWTATTPSSFVQSVFFNFVTKTWEDNEPLTLSPNGDDSSDSSAAVSADGSAFVVWSNDIVDSNQARVGAAITINPPRGLKATQSTNRFPTQSELFNTLTWKPSTSKNIVFYRILRNGEQIGQVSAKCPLEFEDHNRKKGVKDTYEVIAVDALGNESDPATITI